MRKVKTMTTDEGVYEYDLSGNIVTERLKDRTVFNTYDENGRCLTERVIDSLNKETITSYEYDEYGNQTKVVTETEGKKNIEITKS